MAEIDEVAKAKSDLVASGKVFLTICDAYEITNLAAKRNGWKVIQKTSGENCQGRKVDGIIKDGGVYDCLISAGPPDNANRPAWQYLGPVNNLIPVEPFDWPDPVVPPNPNPDPNPPRPDTDFEVASLKLLTDIRENTAQTVRELEAIRESINSASGAFRTYKEEKGKNKK